MDALRSERGSVVLGALTKPLMIAVVVLAAVTVYDAGAIAYARYTASDRGAVAADSAGETWRASHDIQKAFGTAKQRLAATGETIDPGTFSIASDDTVSFEVHASARTLLAQHLSFSEPWTKQVVHIQTSSIAPGP